MTANMPISQVIFQKKKKLFFTIIAWHIPDHFAHFKYLMNHKVCQKSPDGRSDGNTKLAILIPPISLEKYWTVTAMVFEPTTT